MVSMLSSITEMPPLLRASYENIISHFLICHSSPDLNQFFETNQKELFSIFKEPIFLPKLNIKVQVNIISIVADLIEIPKLLNFMQFNAKEGSCLQCFIKPSTVIKCNYYNLFRFTYSESDYLMLSFSFNYYNKI